MSYIVNPENIARICIQTQHDLGQGDFDKVEICLGLSEALARIIVDSSKTPVEGQDLVRVASEHMTTALKIGFNNKGFNI
jgi:hypothetical protein